MIVSAIAAASSDSSAATITPKHSDQLHFKTRPFLRTSRALVKEQRRRIVVQRDGRHSWCSVFGSRVKSSRAQKSCRPNHLKMEKYSKLDKLGEGARVLFTVLRQYGVATCVVSPGCVFYAKQARTAWCTRRRTGRRVTWWRSSEFDWTMRKRYALWPIYRILRAHSCARLC